MRFNTWLENRNAYDAIIGAISPEADADERADIMSKKTTFFSSDIRKKIKNLGILRNMGPEEYGQLVSEIDDGIVISRLIKRTK